MNYLNESPNAREEKRCQVILEENRSWKDKYSSLLKMMESQNPDHARRAKNTLQIMANQALVMEAIRKNPQLEATFNANLNTLVPKVIDLVRIFYPNLVANELVDIQPMDRQNGEVFIVKPVFSTSAAGVTAQTQVFQNITDGSYSSETQTLAVGTGDGALDTFTATFGLLPVRPKTVTVTTSGGGSMADDGNGTLVQISPDGAITLTGTIVYSTGVVTVNATNLTTGHTITATSRYDSESTPANIRELEIQLGLYPVSAVPHPLRVKWSQTAELAAAAHLDLDVPDVLTNLVASFIKQERDVLLINNILAAAQHESTLDFDATPPTNYSRLARYAELEVKLSQAESLIQADLGRGGISWVLCGNNAAGIFRQVNGFEAVNVVAPIGPHKIGTLRDGTVAVIKVPFMNVNTYVVGFKGYVVGDSAAILAEWVPLYASPVFRSPDLLNSQGMMSLYALVMNQVKYYRYGTISGFVA